MSAFRHHLRLWAIWSLAVSGLLMANPWGQLGWVELAAALGPLVMVVERRVRRELALAIGLPTITLLWLADPAGASVSRLLIAWLVFGVGVMLAARTVDSQAELDTIAGQVAFAPPDAEAFERFEVALERELGRARRHERAFALLSAAAHPRSLEADPSGALRSELLGALAESRARLELRDYLQGELHVYSDVVATGDRVLALVPEIEGVALETLVERLHFAAGQRLDFDLQIGVSCFPHDAVCADELIAAADHDRTASKLRSLSERRLGAASDRSTELAPDVQG
ncbi:MAG: hypothetical protein V3T64_01270 [Myxococcota bacterium]